MMSFSMATQETSWPAKVELPNRLRKVLEARSAEPTTPIRVRDSSGPPLEGSTRLQSVRAPTTKGPLVPSASELCELVCRRGVSQAPSARSGPTATDSTGGPRSAAWGWSGPSGRR